MESLSKYPELKELIEDYMDQLVGGDVRRYVRVFWRELQKKSAFDLLEIDFEKESFEVDHSPYKDFLILTFNFHFVIRESSVQDWVRTALVSTFGGFVGDLPSDLNPMEASNFGSFFEKMLKRNRGDSFDILNYLTNGNSESIYLFAEKILARDYDLDEVHIPRDLESSLYDGLLSRLYITTGSDFSSTGEFNLGSCTFNLRTETIRPKRGRKARRRFL